MVRTLAGHATFAAGHESYLARYNDDIRAGLQASYVNESFFAKSGYCEGRNRIAFISSILITNLPVGASLFKVKATRYARFFNEFMCSRPFALGGLITVEEAQKKIFDNFRWLLTDGNGHFSTDFSDIWYPAPAVGEDPREDAMRQMDDNMNDFLVMPQPEIPPATFSALIGQMSDVAWNTTGSKYRKAFYKYMVTNLICLAKMGTVTEIKLDNINQQMQEELKMSLDVTCEECPEIFRALSLIMKAGEQNAVVIMRGNLGAIGLADASRLYLTMTQSVDAGLTGVTVIAEALSQFPASRIWVYLSREAPVEFARWTEAARLVAEDGFIGYGTPEQKEMVKSTLFPNLFYAAREILLIYGGENNIRGIKTATRAQKKMFIDRLLEQEKNDIMSGIDMHSYEYPEGETVMDFAEGMPAILSALTG